MSTSATAASSSKSSSSDVYGELLRRFAAVSAPHDPLRVLSSLPRANHAVLLVAGDQCTGKSTVTRRLATALRGRSFGAGEIFRARAKAMGITPAELSRRALADPMIDVSIEWELCKLLCSGDTNGPLVIEGRQPAVMEQFVRRMLGRPCTFRLRLSCSIPEQALRFIEREVGPEVAARIAPLFPHPSPSLRSLSQLSPLLARVPDSILPTQARERIACMFADNDSRDEDDARRYRELYGADPLLNHQTPELYDCILDTTRNQADDTFEQVLFSLSRHVLSQPADSVAPALPSWFPLSPLYVRTLRQHELGAHLNRAAGSLVRAGESVGYVLTPRKHAHVAAQHATVPAAAASATGAGQAAAAASRVDEETVPVPLLAWMDGQLVRFDYLHADLSKKTSTGQVQSSHPPPLNTPLYALLPVDSLSQLESHMDADPGCARHRYNLASCLLLRGEVGESLLWFECASHLASEAEAGGEGGGTDGASELEQLVPMLQHNYAVALLLFAATATSNDEASPLRHKAETLLRRATEQSHTPDSLLALAALLHQQGRLDEARQVYEHVLARDERNLLASYGLALLRAGDARTPSDREQVLRSLDSCIEAASVATRGESLELNLPTGAQEQSETLACPLLILLARAQALRQALQAHWSAEGSPVRLLPPGVALVLPPLRHFDAALTPPHSLPTAAALASRRHMLPPPSSERVQAPPPAQDLALNAAVAGSANVQPLSARPSQPLASLLLTMQECDGLGSLASAPTAGSNADSSSDADAALAQAASLVREWRQQGLIEPCLTLLYCAPPSSSSSSSAASSSLDSSLILLRQSGMLRSVVSFPPPKSGALLPVASFQRALSSALDSRLLLLLGDVAAQQPLSDLLRALERVAPNRRPAVLVLGSSSSSAAVASAPQGEEALKLQIVQGEPDHLLQRFASLIAEEQRRSKL